MKNSKLKIIYQAAYTAIIDIATCREILRNNPDVNAYHNQDILIESLENKLKVILEVILGDRKEKQDE